MRRAAKVDLIQPEVVRALRSIGASVEILSAVGKGCPDILVGYQGVNYLMELKDPGAPKRHEGTLLTEDQCRWHQAWGGAVRIVSSTDEALAVVTGASSLDASFV